MNRVRAIGMATALGAVLVLPALARTSRSSSTNRTSPADTLATLPLGLARMSHDKWRGRTLIGTPVFSDSGQRIGTVYDLLIKEDGRVDQVILSVRKVRGKLIAVPFNDLRFGPSRNYMPMILADTDEEASPSSSLSNEQTYGALLSGASRDSLTNMETFRFAP